MRWTCTGCGKEWRYFRHIWTFPYLYRVLFESIIWMGIFLSVFIAQVAEMRALKKEVHRQMQIHGDYKVGGTLSSNGHGGWAGIFRAGTTERTLPSMPGSRGRVMCSTQSRGWDGLRKFFFTCSWYSIFSGHALCWPWPHSQIKEKHHRLIVFIVWRNLIINTKASIRTYIPWRWEKRDSPE